MDETFDEDILVANTPTLVYNNDYKCQHHHNKCSGKCNSENKCYIHTHC